MKRLLTLALALTMLLSLFALAPGALAGEQELIPMRYYMPGAPTNDADVVNAAINEKLHADGVMIEFIPMYIPWDQWVNKINVMLSSGEEFELLHVMEDWVTTSMYAGRGQLTPLDDLIDEYAPDMWDRFDDILWQCAKVNGQVMTIPDFWRDNSGDGEGVFNFNEQKHAQYDIPIPTTIDEMFEYLPQLQEKWAEEDGVIRYVYEHSDTRCPVALHRSYDSWPFYASQDGLFQVFQDGTAALYFESEEFKKDCDFMHRAYEAGLIHPDTLNQPQDEINQLKREGDYLMGIMTGGTAVFEDDGTTVKYTYKKVWLDEDKPFLLNLPLLNSNAVPNTTPHPEAGLLFLDWMYSSKENQDLVLYGIEGTHWTAPDENTFHRILDEYGTALYAFDSWMIEYVPYHRFEDRDTSSQWDRDNWMYNVREDNTVVSAMTGFNFDTEPVKVEYANMVAEYTTSILPIKKGVIAYEDGFDAAMEKMKAAGCDAVIAEYQRQLDAYIASKGE